MAIQSIDVADKTTLNAVKTKTDLIGATGDASGSATAGTVMGKLNKVITMTNQIGATGDTGGSATAGTVMAKLNAAFSKANTASTNASNAYSRLNGFLQAYYTPSTSTISTILSTETTYKTGTAPVLIKSYTPTYSGIVRVAVTVRSGVTNRQPYIGVTYTDTVAGTNAFQYSINKRTNVTTDEAFTMDVVVTAGQPIYIWRAMGNAGSSTYDMVISSLKICGSTKYRANNGYRIEGSIRGTVELHDAHTDLMLASFKGTGCVKIYIYCYNHTANILFDADTANYKISNGHSGILGQSFILSNPSANFGIQSIITSSSSNTATTLQNSFFIRPYVELYFRQSFSISISNSSTNSAAWLYYVIDYDYSE